MGTGHFSVHCTESAHYAWQVVLFTGPAAEFLMVFPEAAVFVVPHTSLLIHLFATNQTRDQKAQHGPQRMLNSWGDEVRNNKSWLVSWVILFWGDPFSGNLCHHHHTVRGEGLDLEGRGLSLKWIHLIWVSHPAERLGLNKF